MADPVFAHPMRDERRMLPVIRAWAVKPPYPYFGGRQPLQPKKRAPSTISVDSPPAYEWQLLLLPPTDLSAYLPKRKLAATSSQAATRPPLQDEDRLAAITRIWHTPSWRMPQGNRKIAATSSQVASAEAAFSSDGDSTAVMIGASRVDSIIEAQGIASAQAIAAALAASVANAAGLADALARGASLASSVLNAQGLASAIAEGEEVAANVVAGAAEAAGLSSVEAEGAALAAAEFSAEGIATVEAVSGAAQASTVITLGARNRWREERLRREQLEREEEEDFATLVRFATQHIVREHMHSRGARM